MGHLLLRWTLLVVTVKLCVSTARRLIQRFNSRLWNWKSKRLYSYSINVITMMLISYWSQWLYYYFQRRGFQDWRFIAGLPRWGSWIVRRCAFRIGWVMGRTSRGFECDSRWEWVWIYLRLQRCWYPRRGTLCRSTCRCRSGSSSWGVRRVIGRRSRGSRERRRLPIQRSWWFRWWFDMKFLISCLLGSQSRGRL